MIRRSYRLEADLRSTRTSALSWLTLKAAYKGRIHGDFKDIDGFILSLSAIKEFENSLQSSDRKRKGRACGEIFLKSF